MAKNYDWEALLKQYAIDYEAETISPAEWCERVGLPYSSAKRYITVKAAKTEIALRNSQAKKKTPKPGRDERGYFLKGHQIPECTGQNMDNLVNFEKGHTHSLKHGGYAKLIRNPEDLEVADEAEIIGLIAERRMYRARIASALRTINELEGQIEEGIDDPDKISSMIRLIAAANNSIERCVGRVESLTKTLSSIRIDDVNGPRLAADHKRIVAAEGKLLAETDKLGRKSTAESVTYQLDW